MRGEVMPLPEDMVEERLGAVVGMLRAIDVGHSALTFSDLDGEPTAAPDLGPALRLTIDVLAAVAVEVVAGRLQLGRCLDCDLLHLRAVDPDAD
jgi:hypothetical protein